MFSHYLTRREEDERAPCRTRRNLKSGNLPSSNPRELHSDHDTKRDVFVLTEDQRNNIMGHVPLKRLGKPEDVAVAVRLLASEVAGYINGHVLNLNGAMYM